MPSVRINRKAVSRIESGHPWIFASDVLDRGEAQPGDAVCVVDPQRQKPGHSALQLHVADHLRLLSRRVETIDRELLQSQNRGGPAISARQWCVIPMPTGLIHAEGDLLPGLIVDRYGDYFVPATARSGHGPSGARR